MYNLFVRSKSAAAFSALASDDLTLFFFPLLIIRILNICIRAKRRSSARRQKAKANFTTALILRTILPMKSRWTKKPRSGLRNNREKEQEVARSEIME